jgi:transposase
MEASGYARWFERLLAELQIELWIGDAAEIRTKRVRKQKTDRQDARLILQLRWRIDFRRSGCRAGRTGICGNCCGTGTAWCRRAPGS